MLPASQGSGSNFIWHSEFLGCHLLDMLSATIIHYQLHRGSFLCSKPATDSQRLLQENSTVMGGVQKEKEMLLQEFWRRLREETFPMSLFNRRQGDRKASATV